MTIYLVVLMAFLSQAGFGGSRVAVSLHALDLTANQFAIGVVIALYALCPMLLAIVIVVGSVVHGILIEGAMETVSKAALCVLVLAATVKIMVGLRVWRKRKTLRGESIARQ